MAPSATAAKADVRGTSPERRNRPFIHAASDGAFWAGSGTTASRNQIDRIRRSFISDGSSRHE
jgi:hypothetical protein